MKSKLTEAQRKKIMKQFGGRMPTQEEIFEKIKASQERLMTALAGAARTAPNDPEIKKQLMEAIEKAGSLRKRIYKEVIKEAPPKIHNDLDKSN